MMIYCSDRSTLKRTVSYVYNSQNTMLKHGAFFEHCKLGRLILISLLSALRSLLFALRYLCIQFPDKIEG